MPLGLCHCIKLLKFDVCKFVNICIKWRRDNASIIASQFVRKFVVFLKQLLYISALLLWKEWSSCEVLLLKYGQVCRLFQAQLYVVFIHRRRIHLSSLSRVLVPWRNWVCDCLKSSKAASSILLTVHKVEIGCSWETPRTRNTEELTVFLRFSGCFSCYS